MLIEHPALCSYLLGALEASPELLSHLLRDLRDEEADFRPDSARFTLREVMAHLADWDEIFLERLQRTRDEEEPFLPDVDEDRLVLDHNYAASDVQEQLRLFGARRAQIADFARGPSLQEWQKFCQHERGGRLSLEVLVTLIPLHDAYHLRQVVQWRERYASEHS